jgi:ferric-dicitrate binding protein FerR (iron transport regulator)
MTDQEAQKMTELLTEIRDLTKQRNELAVQTREALQQQAEAVSRRQADALAEVKARRADERKRMYITAGLVLVCLVMFAVGIIIIMTRR